jgi:hypothetical protein
MLVADLLAGLWVFKRDYEQLVICSLAFFQVRIGVSITPRSSLHYAKKIEARLKTFGMCLSGELK